MEPEAIARLQTKEAGVAIIERIQHDFRWRRWSHVPWSSCAAMTMTTTRHGAQWPVDLPEARS